MNDQGLRALIREVVARRLTERAVAEAPRAHAPALVASGPATHTSHDQYLTLVNIGETCLIEPAVACNHCGYCKCHGY